ncbi:MAG: hypothetical protein QOI41_4947 [Myxococcales bacterium]|nr:hypothetical protein [Myxococcales bacterium]
MPSSYRFRFAILALSLAPGAAYALACGDGGGGGGGDITDSDAGPGSPPDAAVGPNDAQSAATTMRLAHVAPDLGPVDFCYRMAKTSSFEGPVLGDGIGGANLDAGTGDIGDGGDAGDADLDAAIADAEAGILDQDGGAPSVGYRTVSRYLTLGASGPLTIALIAPGATSCATPLFTADVTLDPGKLSTVAIVGLRGADAGEAPLGLVAFTDDRTTTPAMARVRMIHAALGIEGGRAASAALAVRAAAAQTITIADHVDPKKAGAPSAAVPVDSLGYATIAPVPSPAQLAVGAAAMAGPATTDASSDSWVSQAGALDLRGGSLHTGFVLTGQEQEPFEVLWCTDTSTSGDRTTCVLVR